MTKQKEKELKELLLELHHHYNNEYMNTEEESAGEKFAAGALLALETVYFWLYGGKAADELLKERRFKKC